MQVNEGIGGSHIKSKPTSKGKAKAPKNYVMTGKKLGKPKKDVPLGHPNQKKEAWQLVHKAGNALNYNQNKSSHKGTNPYGVQTDNQHKGTMGGTPKKAKSSNSNGVKTDNQHKGTMGGSSHKSPSSKPKPVTQAPKSKPVTKAQAYHKANGTSGTSHSSGSTHSTGASHSSGGAKPVHNSAPQQQHPTTKAPVHYGKISGSDQAWYNAYGKSIVNGNANTAQYGRYASLQSKYGLKGFSMNNTSLHNMSIAALSGDKKAQSYLKAMHQQSQDAKHGLWNGVKDNQLDANTGLRTAYRHDNPDSAYTKQDQYKTYNSYNDMIMNNKPMTDKQMNYYNSITGHWHLDDMTDPYNQQVYQQKQDKQKALNAQDVAFNSSQVAADKASYQNMQDMKQQMSNNGMSDSGIAADAYNQANSQNHAAFATAYGDSQQKKSDITSTYNSNIYGIRQDQAKYQADQLAAAQKSQMDLINAQTKQDQYLTQQTGYVYVNGQIMKNNGQPVRTLDYYKMNETQRHDLATENNVAVGNQVKEDGLSAQMAHWAAQDSYNQGLLNLKGGQLNEQIKKDSENAQLGRDKLNNAKDKQHYDFYYGQMKSADSHITALQRKTKLSSADQASLNTWNNKRNKAIQEMGTVYGKEGFNDGGGGGGNYTTYAGYKAWKGNLSRANANGVPTSANADLTWIASHESSFNPNAQNPKSTAHGYGQFLNSTRREYEKRLGLDYDNPVDQITMMYQYTVDRYGSPAKAKAFWQKHNWY